MAAAQGVEGDARLDRELLVAAERILSDVEHAPRLDLIEIGQQLGQPDAISLSGRGGRGRGVL